MGGSRSNQAPRCTQCRMLEALCICAAIPSLVTRHRWIFIQHIREQAKTTNTGRLAHLALEDSQRSWYRSRVDPPDPPIEWGDPADRVLLYPREGVPPLDPGTLAEEGRPLTVVVLDGTWSQTRKMARSIPALEQVPCVGLPAGAHARFSLREETFEGGMSTLDAVCWLAGALEGPSTEAPLLRLNRMLVERTMASRGTPLPGGPRIAAGGLVER